MVTYAIWGIAWAATFEYLKFQSLLAEALVFNAH